jgi:hypothetical protein
MEANSSIDIDSATEIANFLRTLPASGISIHQGLTERVWQAQQGLNEFNQVCADCFRAKHTGEDDPIACLAKGDRSDRRIHNLIWSQVDLLDALWNLCQQCHIFFQEKGSEKSIPFPIKAIDVFKLIIHTEENNTFNLYCKDFQLFSTANSLKEARIQTKPPQFRTDQEFKELQRLYKDLPSNPWYEIFLRVADEESEQSSSIKKALDTFLKKRSSYNFARKDLLEAGRKGRLKFGLYDFAMINGKEVRRKKKVS